MLEEKTVLQLPLSLQDGLQALAPSPPPPPSPGPQVNSQSPKGSIAHACLWMETSSAASVQQQNLPANSQSRLMSKLTHGAPMPRYFLHFIVNYAMLVNHKNDHSSQGQTAECTQICVAQDINFLPVPLSGNHPHHHHQARKLHSKDCLKEFLSCCLWNSLAVVNPWTKNGSVC